MSRSAGLGSTIVGFIVSITSLVAQENVFSSLCYQRAKDAELLGSLPLNQYEAVLNDPSINDKKPYRLEKLQGFVRQTLDEIKSDVFLDHTTRSFLVNCSEHPSACFNYFNERSPKHVRWFCDLHLYINATSQLSMQLSMLAERCKRPDDYFGDPYSADDNYIKQCTVSALDRETKTIITAQKTRAIEREKQRADAYAVWINHEIEQAITTSTMPDAVAFVIYKVLEDLSPKTLSPKEFRARQNAIGLLSALDSLPQFEYSSEMQNSGSSLQKSMEMFLEKNNLQYVFRPNEVTLGWLKFKEKSYYDEWRTTGVRPKDFFQPLANMLASSSQPNADSLDRFQRFEQEYDDPFNHKWDDQRKRNFFREFLPYHFVRVQTARLLREFQKLSYKKGSDLLSRDKTGGTFVTWAEETACQDSIVGFCSKDFERFRREKWTQLYARIADGVYPTTLLLAKDAEETRPYIFTSEGKNLEGKEMFLSTLNQKIKQINSFCWRNAEAPQKLNPEEIPDKKPAELNALMILFNEFLTVPRIEYLLGQSEFIQEIRLDPENLLSNCFIRGYVFGGAPSFSDYGESASNDVVDPMSGWTRLQQEFETLRPIDVYIEPSYFVSMDRIINVERKIELAIQQELEVVDQMRSEPQIKKINMFLEESAAKRILSVMDYLSENPSYIRGYVLSKYMEKIETHERNKTYVLNAVFYGSIIATTFLIPETGILLINSGRAALLLSTAAASSAVQLSDLYKQQQNLNMASATLNADISEVAFLHGRLDKSIDDAWLRFGIMMLFTIVTDGYQLAKFSQSVLQAIGKGELQAEMFAQLEMFKLIRRTPRNLRYILFDKNLQRALMKQMLDDKSNYDAFVAALQKGEITGYLQNAYGGQFKHLVESKEPSLGKKEGPIARMASVIAYPFQRALRFFRKWPLFVRAEQMTYRSPLWTKLRVKIFQYLYMNSMKAGHIERQYVFVDLLNHALSKGAITQEEVQLILGDMKLLAIKEGKVVMKLSDDKAKMLEFFLSKVTRNAELRSKVQDYFYTVFLDDFFSPQEWNMFLKNFTEKITSIEDCKSLLTVVKYGDREFRFLGEKMAQRITSLNNLDFREKYIDIITNPNTYFKIDKIRRNQNHMRIFEVVDKYLSENPGKTIDELHELIRNVDDYDLKWVYSQREKIEEAVATADTSILNTNPYTTVFYDELTSYNDKFYNIITSKLKRNPADFIGAYKSALVRTQLVKSLNQSCLSTSSEFRFASDKAFKAFSQVFSSLSLFNGYYANHSDDPNAFDVEWWVRGLYDVAMTYSGQMANNKAMLQRGVGATQRMWDQVLKYGWDTSALDFGGYTLLNQIFKKQDRLYREIRSQVLIDQGLPEKMREFLVKHPDIAAEMDKKFTALNTIWEKYQGTEGQGKEEQLYQDFLKAGLIEELKEDVPFHEMTKKALEEAFYFDGYSDPSANNIDYFGYSFTPPTFVSDTFDFVQVKTGSALKNTEIAEAVNKYLFFGKTNMTNIDIAQGLDRIIFYKMIDMPLNVKVNGFRIPINPFPYVSFARSQMVYDVLCTMRMNPAASYTFAILLTAMLKASVDPIKYYARKHITGEHKN